MKVLVIGGAGYVGGHVARRLPGWEPRSSDPRSLVATTWRAYERLGHA